MQTQVEQLTRQRWLQVLSEYRAVPNREYRRRHPRANVDLGVVRILTEQEQRREERTGALLNASGGGMMLRSQDELRPGTIVLLQLWHGEQILEVTGRIVHSTPTVGGYKLGVLLSFPD